jgi:hypothetical protein
LSPIRAADPFTSGHGTIIDNNYNGYTVNGCNSGMGHCYNEIQTTRSTDKGDSGGPEIDQGGPYDTNVGKVIGLNDMIDANYSYAIQVQWAFWDMLNTRP